MPSHFLENLLTTGMTIHCMYAVLDLVLQSTNESEKRELLYRLEGSTSL